MISSSASPNGNAAAIEASSPADRFCIIGAGAAGLAVAKNLRAAGIPFDCLEREDDVGGNWYFGRPHSSVYRSTRLISSKRQTEYPDFPMPDDWPEHPHHEQVWQYLRDYARRFDLRARIEFNTAVERVEPWIRVGEGEKGRGGEPRSDTSRVSPSPPLPLSPSAPPAWIVTLADGTQRRYRGVVFANGHNWDPRWPEFAGRFSGEMLHSAQYKTPEVCRGRRVLVVGGGNSGFDIAVDVAQHATATFHSMRRAYHVLPRFFQGTPIDQCGRWILRWRLPLWFRRLAAARAQRIAWADVAHALPQPDHRLFETHPVINSDWPYAVARGAIRVKPDVRRLAGAAVEFADGSREPIDTIICATGYKLSFPFIDRAHLNWNGDRPDLYLNIFHPERDDLFVAGLIQPDSGVFGLFDYQAQLIAAYIRGLHDNDPVAHRFQSAKRRNAMPLNAGIRYIRSPRHLVEVDHYTYRRHLQCWIAHFQKSATAGRGTDSMRKP